jgi:hypothetical protein
MGGAEGAGARLEPARQVLRDAEQGAAPQLAAAPHGAYPWLTLSARTLHVMRALFSLSRVHHCVRYRPMASSASTSSLAGPHGRCGASSTTRTSSRPLCRLRLRSPSCSSSTSSWGSSGGSPPHLRPPTSRLTCVSISSSRPCESPNAPPLCATSLCGQAGGSAHPDSWPHQTNTALNE